MNTLASSVEMEPERIKLLRFIRENELYYIFAVCAIVGELPPMLGVSKAVRKRAIRCLRSSNCWHGMVTQDEIEEAVRLLRKEA